MLGRVHNILLKYVSGVKSDRFTGLNFSGVGSTW
jgi:hypothetical protein